MAARCNENYRKEIKEISELFLLRHVRLVIILNNYRYIRTNAYIYVHTSLSIYGYEHINTGRHKKRKQQ